MASKRKSEVFGITHRDKKSLARAGELNTAHGRILTPFFMPVATKGSVKHLSLDEVEAFGVRCMISNSFIFYLRPGLETIQHAHGLHQFMGWKHGLFTDSGGFQILDDTFLHSRSEEGVILNNPFNNNTRELYTPEKAMQVQNTLGSDVAMVLDDVPKFGTSKPFITETLARTLKWAKRCKAAHDNDKQLVFGISQGGTYVDLRRKGIAALNKLNFDGMALGGMAIGEPKETMQKVIDAIREEIPENKPVYVMGLGSPEDIIKAIHSGIDIFDSCFPSRIARHGTAMTWSGRVSIENLKYQHDFSRLDEHCDCRVCKEHTKAYIHHLCKNREETGFRLVTFHNIYFVQKLIEKSRQAICEGTFAAFAKQFLKRYQQTPMK
ncbi:MAG: tRNA guanosine(34) transglycosylase Tgt [Candidatus Iainarchaeum archaeon]|uniref:tRNA guanosine(34) transglycosylase Tgt n=1 Tax=Candidatus Iainarchaeum sp. TaxID=3101447 RepID=A0A7T9DK09_9ARCH|nr:MAG: tRNA guanosine(34) transglycosylase Tgt [Candidatus Diapherotrites archaeon]